MGTASARIHLLRTVTAIVMALFTVSGCGSSSGSAGGSDGSGTTVAAEETSAPPTESSGNEPAQSAAPSTVSISLPGLPGGGNSQLLDNDKTIQCAFVGWAGPQIPDNYQVTFTDFVFKPDRAFAIVDNDCGGGHRSCQDAAFRLTSNNDTCVLAIKFTGRPTGDKPILGFNGQVTCTIAEEQQCRSFAGAVAQNGPVTIALQPLADSSSSASG